jgi:hypothetical protein
VPLDQVCHPAFGERAHRLFTLALGEKAQRGHRQIVVGVLELRPTSGGEQENLGGTATAPMASAWC